MQIKKIAYTRADYIYESNEYIRIQGRRRQGLVSYAVINPRKGCTSTTVYSVIVYFARRQECLSASTRHIVPRIALS